MLGKSELKVLRRTALAMAAGLAVASSGVYAQSNATGTVYGTVTSAAPGSVIVVENVSTGAKRTVTPDGKGRYQLTALPPGNYKVSLMKGDTMVSNQNVEVLIGQGAEVTFASSANQLETVQVTGTRRLIDTQATNSVSTFTAKQLAALPIGQDLTSIILLAPDTVKADPRYAGGASIGGGAPSENSYYIDGFPVTNALSQLGSIELPFGAISQANVLTGGFGAEFGRSTGGVMNVVTKSGGNKWEGGAFVQIEPSSLRSSARNIYYANTGVPDSKSGKPFDGEMQFYNKDNTKTEYKYGAYVGGPVVQDKVFLFVALDQTKDKDSGINGSYTSSTLDKNGWSKDTTTNNRWLAKVDWQITDDHRVTVMNFGDNYTTDASYYSFDYGTLTHGSTVKYTGHYVNQPNVSPAVGGQGSMIKYTGNLTNNLVLTALYGEATSRHVQNYGNFAPGIDTTVPGLAVSGAGAAPDAGLVYQSPNPLSTLDVPTGTAEDKTKSGRLDLEWSVGSHTLRAGIDKVKLSSQNAGQVEAGGATWVFRKTTKPLSTIVLGPYSFQISDNDPNNLSLASRGYYVRKHVFSDVTNATSDQDAEYIEDKWQVNKKLFLQMGLRNEGFSGANGEGATYLKSTNFISPRLAGAYDVYGDGGLTLKGSIGRYSIQTPTHLAVRGAGISTLTYQYYRYTGIDANGQPTGLTALNPVPVSPDGETGQPKDALTYAARDLKPSYQDELRLGFDKALSPTVVGSFMLTYRKLGTTLDDYCGSAFDNYAAAHGIPIDNYAGDGGCYLINPGRNNTFLVDYAGDKKYTTVTLTPADIGFPEKPKRTFLALDFSLEHPFSNGWYGKVTYTWSQNKGNTEGQTKSDIGQTDVSATETWDFPQLMEGANGYLPNDRTHQIHAFGYYQASPEITIGGNFTAQSGRPKNCFGNYGGSNPDGDPGYGSAFFYCSFDGGNTSVPTPRASQGRLPWDYSLDANVIYKPGQVKGLTLRMDVFNLLNKQTVQAINEVHENDLDPSSLLSTYGTPISYSAPRAVRLTARYEF